MKQIIFVAAGVLALGPAVYAQPEWVSLDPTAEQWLASAQDSRSDMLILGDSVVLFGGHGWDDGFNRALADRVGLAGTGLLHDTASGDGFRLIAQFGWVPDVAAAPEAVRTYSVQNKMYTTGTGSQRRLGVLVESSSALAGRAMTLTGWGGSASGADILQGAARRSTSPYNVYFQSDTDTLGLLLTGLDSVSFGIPSGLSTPVVTTDYYINGSDDSSYTYLRLLDEQSTGATVTSIGYGGQSTRSFYQDIWTGGSWDAQGRATYLANIVEGGSGKLLVPLFEGFNDRNETDPSLTLGITPGDSAAAFTDNIDTLIEQIRADWAFAGLPAEDIGFVVFGMYDIQGEPDAELDSYRDAMRQYASDSGGVSFVDLNAVGLDYTQAQPLGLFSDTLHLSRTGTHFYAGRVMDVLQFASCPGDIADDFGSGGADGQVSFGDFLALLSLIGPCDAGGIACRGDIADDFGTPGPDGQVSFGDFLAKLGRIGPCD